MRINGPVAATALAMVLSTMAISAIPQTVTANGAAPAFAELPPATTRYVVQAESAAHAALFVYAAGGAVARDLPAHDAIIATLSADQARALRGHPEVLAVAALADDTRSPSTAGAAPPAQHAVAEAIASEPAMAWLPRRLAVSAPLPPR